MQNDNIRRCVGAVDRQISLLSAEATTGIGRTTLSGLTTSWAELVEVMALGPEPDRECPVCHHVGMRDATRCGFCWTKLAHLPPAASMPA